MRELPVRIVVGANGAYWRDYGDHYSMCPVSNDNDPVNVVAVYVRAEKSETEISDEISYEFGPSTAGSEETARYLAVLEARVAALEADRTLPSCPADPKEQTEKPPGVDRIFGGCSEHGAYELPLASIECGDIERRCPACPADPKEQT